MYPGKKGEVVLTSLTKEAMPLKHYRTGDITSIMEDECSCGSTHTRLEKVVGRTDDTLIVRVINVFPSRIEGVLVGIPGIGDLFQVVINRKRHELDEIHIRMELVEGGFTGELKDLGEVKCSVEDKLKAVLNLRTVVELVARGVQFQGLRGRLRVRWKHMGSLVKDLFIRGLGEGIRMSML